MLKNDYKIFILFIQRYHYAVLYIMGNEEENCFVTKISKQFKESNFILFFILKFQGSELTFLTVHCTEYIPTEKCFYYILSFLKYNKHQHKLFSQGLTKIWTFLKLNQKKKKIWLWFESNYYCLQNIRKYKRHLKRKFL